MPLLPPYRPASPPPRKRARRTATGVLAGEFEPRPPRDVLTRLLNGVGPYLVVEKDDEVLRTERREKRERERLHKKARARAVEKKDRRSFVDPSNIPGVASTSTASARSTPGPSTSIVNSSTSSFWRARGPIAPATRSVSPSPPPLDWSSQRSTPNPSISSSTSCTSSKRPHTPDDDMSGREESVSFTSFGESIKQRKKRAAVRKGWKGWVEGSPPPSDKLINLDTAPIMKERRTRSGKNFDAICLGQDTWI